MESVQKPGSQLLSSNTNTSPKTAVHKIVAAEDTILLDKNQIIRGLVTDLRPGEVSLRLINKQAVTAHLEGHNEVSIGDVASFKILENKDGEITLYKMNSTVTPEENTILKALEEANLPANDANIEIVKELLYNQLPINKESINMVLRQAMQYKDAQISTLVYLNKNSLPLNEEFIKTFEQYRNFDYQLLDNIQTAKDEFVQFMGQVARNEPDSSMLSFARQVMDFLVVSGNPESLKGQDASSQMAATLDSAEAEEMSMMQAMADSQELASIHTDLTHNSIVPLTGKEQHQLTELFSSYDMPEEFMQSIENNTVSLREMVHHITEALTIAANTNPAQIEAFKTPVILDIMEQYGSFQQSNDEVASFLTTNERMELLDSMGDFPISIADAAAIANGEMTSGQLLNLISGFIVPDNKGNIRKLLSSKSFHKLVSHQMTGEFCLTPEALKEENGVQNYYTSILNKMDKLKAMTSPDKVKTNPAAFHDKTEGVKDSVDFMKTFNQLFTYVQLPVKLTKQITHGDLYVYTNKEKLKAGTDQVSVLLHLAMDNLGPLDIHLSLNRSTLHGKFYVQDKEVQNLLTKHEDELRTSLNKIGYQLNMEIYQQTKEVDILKDIKDADSASTPIKRYSFDIRA